MKYFIVYTNGHAPENYNVFYSSLVIAEDEASAIEKYCARDKYGATPQDFGDEDCGFGIEEFTPIV